MTVIVAAKIDDGICLAADSLTTAGWEKLYSDRSKLWTADPYVLGAAGSVRASQVVKHFTSWPKYRADEDTDLEAFLVKSIVPAIFTGSADKGVISSTNGVNRLGCALVIAWGDHLAQVWPDGAVAVPRSGRCAEGSGYAEALGYLGSTGPWTIDDVCEAAQRACISSLGCAGPIDYVTTTDRTVRRWPGRKPVSTKRGAS